MKKVTLQKILIINLILFVLVGLLFCWQLWGQLHTDKPIDSNRFANFGSFIAGIFGFINFILLLYSFRETKDQSFNNFFFNVLQIHDSVVKDLKLNGNEIAKLNSELTDEFYMCENLADKSLREECISYREKQKANDYFELLYRILHIRYKYKGETFQKYFTDEYWRIGHYLRSFISIIEILNESSLDESKKSYYIRVIQSRSSSDEIRLIFYYLLSNNNERHIKLAKIFNSFNFFDIIKGTLIINETDDAFFKALINTPRKKANG